MLKDMVGKSINFKFLTVISVILLISTILSSALIARYEQVLLRRSLNEKGNSLISYIAKLSKDPLVMKDHLQLDGIVHEVTRDEEVVYAVIKDSGGNVVTTRFSSVNSQASDIKTVLSGLPKDSELPEIIEAIKKTNEVVEISVPILMESESLGMAAIGMSNHNILKQVTRTVVFVLIINIVTAVLLGTILFIATKRIVVDPILKLTAISERLASGDLSQEVRITTKDEIGVLSRATNKMIHDLKSLIGNIRETATKTMSMSANLVSGSRQVKLGAVNTSKAAEETFVSMEEMASSAKSVAETAESLSVNVEQASNSITEMIASVENLARNVSELSSSLTESSSTVEEMTVSIENVAREAEELTSVVHNAAASVEQMTKSMDQVDNHIQEAGVLSARSVEVAKMGGEALSRSFTGMKNISETMAGIVALIQNLGASSRQIGNILDVIDEIADQTNLLALNAAIQAAQAGDAGRGFAVVAMEVRGLADRSRIAAKEIGEVIKRVQVQTQDAVKSTESGARESASAMEMADRASEALNKIIMGVEKTNEIMNEIMSSTAEQKEGSKEVLTFVKSMRISSDQVKRAMTEQAAGGRQIRASVENINRIVREVDRAAREQAVGSKQIVVAVENMNQMTQQVSVATTEQKHVGAQVMKSTENISNIAKENLSAVEQMAKSSDELVAESQALLKNVESFKL